MIHSIDISSELFFKTARSGGKGGQHVNKTETMVEGYWDIAASEILSEEQKILVQQKLKNYITAEGLLQVKSQKERSQLLNKKEVIKKINRLVQQALRVRKKRISTQPSAAAREKRMHLKKLIAEKKQQRRKNF